jgi:4-amino-4-deoxy-L-arabinose transferase-like glycosyltransferase
MNRLQRFKNMPELYLVLGIGFLALMIRISFSFFLYPHLEGPLSLGTDPDQFGQLAMNWVDGKGYILYEGAEPTVYRGPGFPLLLAAVYLIFGNLFPAAVLVQSLIGSLVCLVMYYIGKRVFNSWVGYAAALLGALHPLLIWYSPRLRYEPLLTLLLALAIFWSLRVQVSWKLKDAVLMGFFFGYAALVNQVVLFLPLVLYTGFLLLKANRVAIAKSFVVVLLAMMAIIIPWTIRNYQVSDLIIPVHSGGITQFVKSNYEFEQYYRWPLQAAQQEAMGVAYLAQLLGYDPDHFDLRTTGVDQVLFPHALSFLRNTPEKLVTKLFVQIPRFWYLSETPLKSRVLIIIQATFLIPALIGILHTLKTRPHGIPIILTVVYFNIVYAILHVEGRFSTPVVPYVIILAVVGLRSTFEIIRKWHFKNG